MTDFGLFQFASPPRTATTWIRKAAALAGLRENGRSEIHLPHEQNHSVVKVSCVRGPVGWLQSYYASIRPGRVDVPVVDAFYCDENTTFDEFIRRYLNEMPGQVCRMFDAYHADICLRLEDLPWAFIELLDSLGVPRKLRERCLVLGIENPSKILPKWSPSLKARVIDAEWYFIERFEY